jgi:hypothetical protein
MRFQVFRKKERKKRKRKRRKKKKEKKERKKEKKGKRKRKKRKDKKERKKEKKTERRMNHTQNERRVASWVQNQRTATTLDAGNLCAPTHALCTCSVPFLAVKHDLEVGSLSRAVVCHVIWGVHNQENVSRLVT